MISSFFEKVSADAGVKLLLGSSPCRIFPFGDAEPKTLKPYAVYQVGGVPENYVNQTPDIDNYTVNVEVIGEDVKSVLNAAKAIRDAIEPFGHVFTLASAGREPKTKDYVYVITADLWDKRET